MTMNVKKVLSRLKLLHLRKMVYMILLVMIVLLFWLKHRWKQ